MLASEISSNIYQKKNKDNKKIDSTCDDFRTRLRKHKPNCLSQDNLFVLCVVSLELTMNRTDV